MIAWTFIEGTDYSFVRRSLLGGEPQIPVLASVGLGVCSVPPFDCTRRWAKAFHVRRRERTEPGGFGLRMSGSFLTFL
jgi:hypothetical protein